MENPPPPGKCSGAILSIHCGKLLVSLACVARKQGYNPFICSFLIFTG